MDARIFGKEITNINIEQEGNRAKRNYSFAMGDRPQLQALSKGQLNKTLPHQVELKLEITDPQMVPEYFFENMQFLRNREKSTHKLSNYIPTHKTVSEQSRAKLLDWLSELHYKYKMFPETIFTIAALVDQYLAVKDVPLNELQLVGVAALYIAAKFEETYQVPQAKQLVSCCAGQYSITQILEKEADIIKELNF